MSQRLEEKRGARKAEPLGSSPDYRWNAVPSPDRVSVVSDGASWDGRSGNGTTGQAAARLAVTVQVRHVPEATRVWLDVYAFDADGGLVSFGTHDLQHADLQHADLQPADLQRADLQRAEPAGVETSGGELFVLDAPVGGPEPASLSTIPTPVPRRLKYRVYVRPEAGLFTDGLLHDVTLPERRGTRARKRSRR